MSTVCNPWSFPHQAMNGLVKKLNCSIFGEIILQQGLAAIIVQRAKGRVFKTLRVFAVLLIYKPCLTGYNEYEMFS
jgi:hypothetical protein